MTQSKQDLRQLLDSFDEALDFWLVSLGSSGSGASGATATPAAAVARPLDELSKLSQLVRAHTTKVGIIFKPATLAKEASAAFNTFKQLSESVILTVSVLQQSDARDISHIFYDELIGVARLALSALKQLVAELQGLVDADPAASASDDDSGSARLVSIGLIWGHCDALAALLKKGKIGILTAKIKRSIEFVDDGLDEFEEWAHDPQEVGDDPFGLDDFSDDDGEGDDDGDAPAGDGASAPVPAEDLEELVAFSTAWLAKFKLVKLLLGSITKSLPDVTSGATVDKIYTTQKTVVASIDKLIGALTMNMAVNDESAEYAASVNRGCRALVKEVREVNKKHENKVKWCNAWEAKFFD